ncbi:MAG: ATP-grasp domain-containing protein [Deltaproteobacteria bacterium]|nr:ATP-grasp domain-containing protein [Deltaproteobacteria bacterium]
MFLRNLDDAKGLFDSLKGTFAGVGMTAFSRIIPSYFINQYNIVSLRATRDLSLLRKKAEIFCLEHAKGKSVREKGCNSALLLAHPLTRRFLRGLPDPKQILLYQNYSELEALAKKEGWNLIGNPSSLRVQVGQRSFFKQLVSELKLPSIPGHIHPVEALHKQGYEHWAAALGSTFVVQLPEVVQGGGKGTFFINSPSEYGMLKERLKENAWRGTALKSASIHRFMEGIPASMALCLTKHGLLLTGLQKQLIDLPYCGGLVEDGVFCGHVWDDTAWPLSVTQKARKQALIIGEYLNSLGYKGILGIDFLIDKRHEQVYPLEINPRFTGAFPMLSLLHLKDRVIPMEVFHILEFLDVPYRIDVEELNARYALPIKGSHVLLFLLSKGNGNAMDGPDAGLYEYDPEKGRIFFLKGAFDYREIKNESQFIITDGPPLNSGEAFASSDPLSRLCRLLFSCPAADDNGVLAPHAHRAVDWVYKKMGISPSGTGGNGNHK